jgi:hypothetical protein
LQRIRPTQFAEPRKVRIAGHEHASVLHGKRSQMGVGDEISECLAF